MGTRYGSIEWRRFRFNEPGKAGDLQSMLLPDRETIYRIACEAYEQSSGRDTLFEHLVRSDIRVRGLSPLLIAFIVRLAFELFKIWAVQGIHRPTQVKDPQMPHEFEAIYHEARNAEESDHD